MMKREVRTRRTFAPFPFHLELRIVNDPKAEFQKSAWSPHFPEDLRESDFQARFVHNLDLGEGCVFFSARGLKYNQIVHESFHITHRMFKHIGDEFECDHDEPYAYLIDDVFDWIVACAKKKGIRIS